MADNLTSLTEGDPGKSLTKDTDYTVDYWNSTDYGSGTTNSTSKTDDNITISFTSTYLNSLNDRVTIYLRYNATLNSDADVNMPNEAYVIYGDNNTESTHKTVYESTFGFQINKVDSDNNNSPLNGAKFVLSKDGNLTGLSETSSGDNLLSFDSTGTYTTSNGQKVREANNTLIYKGLNDNENNTAQIIYYLYEVKAPDGYFELTGPIAIKIEPKFNTTETTKVDSYTISYKLPTASDYVTISETQVGHIHAFNVPNSQSIALPSTGGIGTTIFYIIGGVLVAGAVVLLIMRQRRKA